MTNELLDRIPAWLDADDVQRTIDLELATLSAGELELDDSDTIVSSTAEPESRPSGALGLYASQRWQKHVLAVLIADWACYPRAANRVTFHRLQLAMHVFPAGFRVWWAKSRAGWSPVGYSAWFPISDRNRAAIEAEPALALSDRGVFAPVAEATKDCSLYLFNYSVLPRLRRTMVSRRLLATLSHELSRAPHRGLAALTVSREGARVAERFGMSARAARSIDGVEERLYLR